MNNEITFPVEIAAWLVMSEGNEWMLRDDAPNDIIEKFDAFLDSLEILEPIEVDYEKVIEHIMSETGLPEALVDEVLTSEYNYLRRIGLVDEV